MTVPRVVLPESGSATFVQFYVREEGKGSIPYFYSGSSGRNSGEVATSFLRRKGIDFESQEGIPLQMGEEYSIVGAGPIEITSGDYAVFDKKSIDPFYGEWNQVHLSKVVEEFPPGLSVAYLIRQAREENES